jgi:methyl-accepting chemotaxis protein
MSNVARELHGAAQTQGSDVTFVVEAMDAVEAKALEISHSSVELSHLVGECTSSVLELGAAGDQLNQTAGSLADRVEVVSSTVEQTVRSVRNVGRETDALVEAAAETSASMKEMASAMGHVDATAAATASLSQQVVAASEFGYEKVLATIEGIESIRGATDTAHTVITRLDGRAQEIGVVVEVISDVADETNLLALNAAIIAAQAGEHGRAFSVVATEIKGLANRVLLSTKEISELVASVQQESQSAINAMAEGARSVAAGVERSGEAGKSLEEIKRISHDSGQRIHEILSSVQEQTIAAGHVVDLMERVRTGVETIQLDRKSVV